MRVEWNVENSDHVNSYLASKGDNNIIHRIDNKRNTVVA